MTRWNFPQTIPKRYVLSLLAFFGFFNAYILRSNLSIAIIAMVKPTLHITTNNITLIKPVRSPSIVHDDHQFFFVFRLVIIGIQKLKVIFFRRSSIAILLLKYQLDFLRQP